MAWHWYKNIWPTNQDENVTLSAQATWKTTATKQWFVAHVYLRMIVSLCTSSCVSSLIKHILPEWPNNNHTHMPKETTRNQISQATYCTLKLKYSALFLPSNYIRDPGSNSVNFPMAFQPKGPRFPWRWMHPLRWRCLAALELAYFFCRTFANKGEIAADWLANVQIYIYIYVYIHYMYVLI